MTGQGRAMERGVVGRSSVSHRADRARWIGVRVLLSAGLLACALSHAPACAEEILGNPQTGFHSFQTFEKDGEKFRALRIPVYITLRSWENRPLGLRLRLAATFAAADLFSLLDKPALAIIDECNVTHQVICRDQIDIAIRIQIDWQNAQRFTQRPALSIGVQARFLCLLCET